MNIIYPIETSQKCFDCGSNLLLIDKRTEIVEGQRSPITTSLFKCSNMECQDSFDKKTILREKQQKEQELAKVKRMENMRLSRIKNKK